MKKIQFSSIETINLADFDTLIVTCNEQGEITTQADFTGKAALQADVQDFIASGDFSAKTGKILTLLKPASVAVARVLVIATADTEKLSNKAYLEMMQALATTLEHSGALKALNLSTDSFPTERDHNWAANTQARIFQRSFYDYAHESRGAHTAKTPKLEAMSFVGVDASALTIGQATALGMELTQDLANMPPNFCTPAYLAQTAEQLAADYGFEVNILEREQMIEMGMGSFMAVAQGSPTPPKMICLSYKGADDEAPIALVGKGVTFDTGGISLKPGLSMDEMKYDMGGAATVLGTFKALGELKPALNVVAVIPATENMPAGNAAKPGDVVTSLSGQTIEILNTDAEGRLILCDALTYAQQTYQPAKIIDMATLTGACIIALGNHVSGIMGNDQTLVDDILAAGNRTYDRFWQLPQGEEWDEQLKSNFADMANIGGREGGTITAGQFLGRFTKDIPWAHLDIAGTAWVSGKNKGASGRPVPALVDYLLAQV